MDQKKTIGYNKENADRSLDIGYLKAAAAVSAADLQITEQLHHARL